MTDVDEQLEPDTDEVDDADGPASAPARQSRGPRDMALSLVVLLVPIAIIVALVWVRGGSDPVVIDTAPTIADARAAGFPVTAPTGLDSGWRPVSASFDPGDPGTPGATLRIGYLTPSGGPVQVIESTAARDGLLIRELGDDPRTDGVVAVAGVDWNSYRVRDGEHALVHPDGTRTVLVIGRADVSELRILAQAVS